MGVKSWACTLRGKPTCAPLGAHFPQQCALWRHRELLVGTSGSRGQEPFPLLLPFFPSSASLPTPQPLHRVRPSLPGHLLQPLRPGLLPAPHLLRGGLRLRPWLRAQRRCLRLHAGLRVPGPSAGLLQRKWTEERLPPGRALQAHSPASAPRAEFGKVPLWDCNSRNPPSASCAELCAWRSAAPLLPFQPGDTWVTANCRQRCTCEGNGKITCQQFQCLSGAFCTLSSAGLYYCRPSSE